MGKDVFSRVLKQFDERGAKSNVPPGYRYPFIEGKPSVARDTAKRQGRLYETEVRRRITNAAVPANWPRQALRNPSMAVEALRSFTEGQDQESAMAIYLDARHRPIAFAEVARGAGNIVSVSPRDVFRYGMAVGAVSLLFAHNHPSGDPSPSQEDTALTRRLQAAGDLVGIPLLDHLVVTDHGFYSFSDTIRGAR